MKSDVITHTGPSWMPPTKCMQRYCEPFYSAVENWRKSADLDLMINRMHLLEVASKVLTDVDNGDKYYAVLKYDNSGRRLLPVTTPTAGRDFINGGDLIALEASKRFVPPGIFNKVGVFFQRCLLKTISVPSVVEKQRARQSILALLDDFFRLPNDAGFALLEFHDTSSDDVIKEHPFSSSTPSHVVRALCSLLHASQIAELAALPSVRPSSSKKKPKPTSSTDSSDALWVKDHYSVGWMVAAYFPSPTSAQSPGLSEPPQLKLFVGEVVSYAPATSSEARDQLYHIVWEDGDEEDYDEDQLRQGRNHYEASQGWTTSSEHVGKKVAAYFTVPEEESRKRKRRFSANVSTRRLFQGTVTRYSPPTTNLARDQLYHIEWEDEDEEDYDEDQFLRGLELYRDNFGSVWLTDHSSVGKEVAAYFPHPKVRNKKILYKGHVTKYSPPTSKSENDELYHILWEDGDEEDYDAGQLEAAHQLFLKSQPSAT
eukprot:gene8040-8870_t